MEDRYLAQSFYHELQKWPSAEVLEKINNTSKNEVQNAIAAARSRQRLTPHDFMALLSPCAVSFMEEIAALAQEITLRHFGRSIQLFTPLYLANICTNRCVYCGFNTKNKIHRAKLSYDEIEQEGRAIAATGLRQILLLTGDAPKQTGPEYIAEAARRLRPFFPDIAIEVYALTVAEYRLLIDAGVNALTLFQETYNEPLFAELHPAGPKHDFRFRLEVPERAGIAGMRCIGLGALLGLDEWRRDAFFTGLHTDYIQRHFPSADVAVSTPRIRPHEGVFDKVFPVSDTDLVQYILATRLFMPTAGITISTRERPFLRNHLIELGITKISGGVSTAVGGHAVFQEEDPEEHDVAQFEISDNRSVAEMAQAIRSKGYQPIYKYWEPLEGEEYHCGKNAQACS